MGGETTTTVLGREAETSALRFLERAGLVLIERNFRCRAGEIDLVMLDEAARVLVLVEVRSRSRRDYGSAAATISIAKQRRCALAARYLYLKRRDLRSLPARFDVIAIDPPESLNAEPRITWLRHAFAVD